MSILQRPPSRGWEFLGNCSFADWFLDVKPTFHPCNVPFSWGVKSFEWVWFGSTQVWRQIQVPNSLLKIVVSIVINVILVCPVLFL